ncbi:magnesium transporter CorA family protein [Priestia koreensis]|uniref:magnesium transporter CorA family protein n=1 Tax=Priestia koreensis TaxID=284581 RepID=UPI001F55CE93|nr:magnesium transporter CorA family protein [Priestia koreensis]MCM3003526.1 magnesium transporter CorA family protein [Priestia koreensis]UNL86318.1 magnesium transporter CorA family protein [Priestia koreensis]
MLEIYKTNADGKLEQMNEIVNGSWISLVNPTNEEINQVLETVNVPIDFLRDPLDDEERSRIEKEDNHVLIIVDYPYVTQDEAGSTVYETIPIGLIITDDYFITVTLKETPILEVFKHSKMKQFYTNKKTRFALQLLYIISTYFLRYLKHINKETDKVEKQLHKAMQNKELYAFLGIEKSLVYFTTSLKANKTVLDKLMRFNYVKIYEEDRDLLEDVIIENTQAIEMAQTYSTILSSMMNTLASVINNNVNIAMKFLTTITIMLSFPTIVFSFFGMNVKLPMSDSPHAFWLTFVISIILSSLTALILRKKRYM